MNFLKTTTIILFLLFISTSVGQTVKCNYCKSKIEGKYIIVDGKAYHQNHFKCAKCNKPILGSYNKKNGKYYDKECYAKLFFPKCSVCGKPIDGKYYIDEFGLKYHQYHEKKLNRCDNCNRLISDKTTRGGVKYGDGRNICNLCNRKKLNSYNKYEQSFNRVISRLGNYGLRFNKSSMELKVVNLTELRRVSGSRYSKNIKGYTATNIRVFGNSKTFKHTIYVLSEIPPKYAEATIAHEFMHVWISENLNHQLSKQLEEGSCNYISYTYLKSDYSDDAKYIMKQLHSNPDKIYGGGYRKVYNRFRGRNFKLFLDYIRNNNKI